VDTQKELQISPLWRMPFRPFFLAATSFSVLAILLWMLSFHLGVHAGGIGLQWHIHEMIMGFAATIILGFALTAAQTWTGIRTAHGSSLTLLFALWLLGRLGWLLSPPLQWLGAAGDVLLFSCAAAFMARMVYRARNWSNAFFVPVFLLFALFSASYAYALLEGNPGLARNLQDFAFYLIVHVVLVVGGRVIPFFTDRRLQRPDTTRYAWLELSALISSLLFLLAIVVVADADLVRWAAAMVATFNLLRWLSWKPWQCSHIPLLWSLYIAYGFIIAGFALIAGQLPYSSAVHMIAVGGFGLMILAMISRVSLGHSGRPLELPPGFSFAYIALIVAALSRTLASLVPEYYLACLWIAALGWITGFGLFLYHYVPILTAPRIDNGPG
jgi:uncharacterized protein involved in response to NO